MYQLTNDRRITQFVKFEARKWLYANMSKYVFNQNNENKALFTEIMTNVERDVYGNNAVSEKLYVKFLNMFENNPIKRKIKSISGKELIISNDIYMHFVRYNNYILPIGFIIEFFEDDYEDKEKAKILIKGFLDDSENVTATNWEKIKYKNLTDVEQQKYSLGNIYKCTAKTYVKYLFVIGFYIVMFSCWVSFVNSSKLFSVIGNFKVDFEENINIAGGIPAFNIGEDFTMWIYLREVMVAFWINLYILIYRLTLIPRIVRETKYIATCTTAKIKLFLHMKIAKKCEDIGGTSIRELSVELISEYLDNPHDIESAQPFPEITKMFDKLDKYNLMLIKDETNEAGYEKYADVKNRKGFNTKFTVGWMAFITIVAYCVDMPPLSEIIQSWINMFFATL